MEMYEMQQESGRKKFWRIVLGTIVGLLISEVIVSILGLIFLAGIIAGVSSKTPAVDDNSILKIKLDKVVSERSSTDPFDDFNMGNYYNSTSSIGLDDILKALKAAATDSKIKGIYLNLSSVAASPASLEEIRHALLTFKESGKFIYAYSEGYTQGAYYLASTADKIFLHKYGEMDFKGLSFEIMFYKGLLDKLGVEMQVIRHGQFKSAVEPYMLDKMSAANRKQMETLANSIWGTMLDDISASRGITVDSLNYFADQLIPANASEALAHRFVDGLVYASDFEDTLKHLVGLKDKEDLHFVSLSAYAKDAAPLYESKNNADKIAIVYAVGEIIDGKGNDETIGSVTLCQDIRDAYEDDDVKAIVLRVNSPGGSALASEVIWHEIELAKAAGKIVVTSMGDYAASGGYYISCNSDAIVAEPNTLTGSIGVFGLLPNIQNFLKNKLGVTTDVAKTNAHSDYATLTKPLDATERARIQAMVEETYALFTSRVAAGRGLPVDNVDSIGQGRVWAGSDALEIGLVDRLGHLDDAVQLAAEMAKLSSYSVAYYPKKTEWFEKFFNMNDDEDSHVRMLKAELGDLYEPYAALRKVMNAKGTQARLPFELIIK